MSHQIGFPLSIIVPVFNEADRLADLFAELERQQAVAFEVLICDGGSTDETLEAARRLGEKASFPCRILISPPGRGRQMNAGAVASGGRFLLFLHVDSSFPDSGALAKGLQAMAGEMERRGSDRVAGHFALRFQREGSSPSLAYYFYEVKACLGRPGTIHGDQGFLLPQKFFRLIGPFDESLGYMEDDRLAVRVFQKGCWSLLPARLQTSARRFEREGFFRRQVLNALIISLEEAGRNDLLQELPNLYRHQQAAGRLRVKPFFARVRRALCDLSAEERRCFWDSSGRLLAANIWQIFLLADAWRGYRKDIPQETVSIDALSWYEKHLEKTFKSSFGIKLCILATWLWLHLQAGFPMLSSRREV
ncbi:MAG: TIGR04283 family arsenosugar biosynthesis glycosyltransferase [Syntrophotaleaceae bacterium]